MASLGTLVKHRASIVVQSHVYWIQILANMVKVARCNFSNFCAVYIFFVNCDVIVSVIVNHLVWLDESLAHRAWEIDDLLKQVTPDFISPSLWPLNGPVHFAVWEILHSHVYWNQIIDVEELHQRVNEWWDTLDQ